MQTLFAELGGIPVLLQILDEGRKVKHALIAQYQLLVKSTPAKQPLDDHLNTPTNTPTTTDDDNPFAAAVQAMRDNPASVEVQAHQCEVVADMFLKNHQISSRYVEHGYQTFLKVR